MTNGKRNTPRNWIATFPFNSLWSKHFIDVDTRVTRQSAFLRRERQTRSTCTAMYFQSRPTILPTSLGLRNFGFRRTKKRSSFDPRSFRETKITGQFEKFRSHSAENWKRSLSCTTMTKDVRVCCIRKEGIRKFEERVHNRVPDLFFGTLSLNSI